MTALPIAPVEIAELLQEEHYWPLLTMDDVQVWRDQRNVRVRIFRDTSRLRARVSTKIGAEVLSSTGDLIAASQNVTREWLDRVLP